MKLKTINKKDYQYTFPSLEEDIYVQQVEETDLYEDEVADAYSPYENKKNMGWQCPRCGKINAPNIKSCDCIKQKEG